MRQILATDQFVWNGQTFRPAVRFITISDADLTVAGLVQTINLQAVTDDTFVPFGARMRLDGAFNSAGQGSLNAELGCTGDLNRFVITFDCYTGSLLEGLGWEPGIPSADPAIGFPLPNTQLTLTLTSTVDNLDTFNGGDFTAEVWGWELVAAT